MAQCSPVEDLLVKMKSLTVAEKTAVALQTPDEEYVLLIDAQSSSKYGECCKVAATSSDYAVRVYTRKSLGILGTIRGHCKLVTGVSFSNTDENLLYTSSIDGIIRCWDLRKSYTSPVVQYTGLSTTSNHLSSFDINCDDTYLAAGTETDEEKDVFILLWDIRKNESLGIYEDSHHDDITNMKFHPTQRDLLATASTDGLVNIFDMSESSEDDALISTLNTESSAGNIGWCGPDYKNIFCITHIETLHVWDAKEGDILSEVTNIQDRFSKKSGSRVDYITSCFEPSIGSDLHLLTGTKGGSCEIMKLTDRDDIEPLTELYDGHSSIVRCMHWDQQSETLITGGEDAMVCLWKSGSLPSNKHSSKRKSKEKSAIKAKMKKTVSSKPF